MIRTYRPFDMVFSIQYRWKAWRTCNAWYFVFSIYCYVTLITVNILKLIYVTCFMFVLSTAVRTLETFLVYISDLIKLTHLI